MDTTAALDDPGLVDPGLVDPGLVDSGLTEPAADDVDGHDVDGHDVDGHDVGEEPGVQEPLPAFDDAELGKPAQASVTAEMPQPRRSGLVLLVVALLALVAGVAAGYLFLMFAS